MSEHSAFRTATAISKISVSSPGSIDLLSRRPATDTHGRPLSEVQPIFERSLSQTFQQAIDDVSAQGEVVVVAAGNDGHSIADQQPANYRGVIAVGASDRNAMRAPFSDFGSNVLLSAPGVDILTTSNDGATTPNNNTYGYVYGTSLAAPQVSGAIVLMLSVNGSLAASSIKQALAASANAPAASAGMSCAARPAGNGILDVAAALNLIDKH